MGCRKPILFIDGHCRVCLNTAQRMRHWGMAHHIQIEHLQDINQDYHPCMIPLASSRTSMILAEPTKTTEGYPVFSYSQKGLAILRLAKYMPLPLRLMAIFEVFPPAVWAMTVLYTLFAKIRKYL